MTVVVEHKNTIDELLMNGPTKQGEEAAVLVHVRLMFLRIGKPHRVILAYELFGLLTKEEGQFQEKAFL